MITDKNNSGEYSVGLAKGFDISNIIKLQSENLEVNLSNDQKGDGFLRLKNSHQEIEDIINGQGVFIVCYQGNNLAGYVFSINKEYAKKINFFDDFTENIKDVQYKNKNINEYNYCILGQLCIIVQHRGSKVLELLHERLRHELTSKGYEIAVTEIDESNTRSIEANINKMGMVQAGKYKTCNNVWLITVMPL
ncbi:MAG: hypothetical protein KBB86_02290 [Candidatus Pacebacteria bacterium]|nr:hypothetical protein [Candidatus Paceibacterota bacterium]